MMFRTPIFARTAFMAVLLCLSLLARAQPAGMLYDPEPPVDSGYARLIFTGQEGPLDIAVDGKTRIRHLASNEFSDYLVLGTGKRTLSVQAAGKPATRFQTTIEVAAGRAVTLAVTNLGQNQKPIAFEDKLNANKLKAQLAIYHLGAQAGPLDILTADGKSQVSSGLTFGRATYIQVNPISIELVAVHSGEKTPQSRTTLTMTQGGAYSVLITSGAAGPLVLQTLQNKIERYTGN